MKSNRWIVAIGFAAACTSFAQITELPPPEAEPAPARFDRDGAREEFRRQKKEIKKRVSTLLYGRVAGETLGGNNFPKFHWCLLYSSAI